jgi:hypothetical protein
MSAFPFRAYALMQHAVFHVTAAPLGSTPPPPPPVRQPVGTAEFIPEPCFIVAEATIQDGFKAADLPSFNGFVRSGFTYHNNFGFPIKRMKSFWEILDFFRASTATINRLRIVTHGWRNWMEFPMFKGGQYQIGITAEQLESFRDSDEAGLRWTLSRNVGKDTIYDPDLSDTLLEGIRALNAPLLAPWGLDGTGTTASGDIKKFLQALSDQYHAAFGTTLAMTETSLTTFVPFSPAQATIFNEATAFIESEVKNRLVTATPAIGPDLDALKAAIIATPPPKLGILGSRKTLQANVFAPATTTHSLAAELAASPRDPDNIMRSMVGTNGWPMFADHTGETLQGLIQFRPTALNLGSVVIKKFPDLTARAPLDQFFGLCSDLHVLKFGGVKKAGGSDLTPTETNTIRDGILAVLDLLKPQIHGIAAAKLNALRTAVEDLTLKQASSTGVLGPMNPFLFKEAKAAVDGVRTGFRANLNRFRTLVKSTTTIDIRGCKVGAHQLFMDNFRNFVGSGTNLPTVTAPDWWQSFQAGASYVAASAPFSAHPKIDAFINANFTRSWDGSPITFTKADITAAITRWKALVKFDPHFAFISGLFADSDTARFSFATLEWRAWQVNDTGPGIPVLRMEAQRVDDLAGLPIGDIVERFRLIFEIPANQGIDSGGRTKLDNLQPHVASFKTLKASIAAAGSPNAGQLGQFYTDLGKAVTDMSTASGVAAPGNIMPAGAQSKANVDLYSGNVETYVFSILNTLLKPFFGMIVGKLTASNAEIRYYANIGLLLPIKSSQRPVAMEVVFLMSFDTTGNKSTLFDKAMRGWMKAQWRGSPVELAALSQRIDAQALSNAERSKRPVVSEEDPLIVNHPVLAEHCPTDEYGFHIKP